MTLLPVALLLLLCGEGRGRRLVPHVTAPDTWRLGVLEKVLVRTSRQSESFPVTVSLVSSPDKKTTFSSALLALTPDNRFQGAVRLSVTAEDSPGEFLYLVVESEVFREDRRIQVTGAGRPARDGRTASNGRTAREEPGNCSTAREEPGNGRTAREEPGNGRTARDEPGNGRTTRDESGNGRTTREETSNDRTASNGRTAREEPDNGRTAREEPDNGRTTREETSNDRTASNGRTTKEEPRNGRTTSNGRTARDESGNGRTARDESGNGRTARDEPGNGRTAIEEPGNGRTARDESGNGRTTREEPGNGRPTRDESGNGRTARDESGNGRTAREEPGNGRTAREEPDLSVVLRKRRQSLLTAPQLQGMTERYKNPIIQQCCHDGSTQYSLHGNCKSQRSEELKQRKPHCYRAYEQCCTDTERHMVKFVPPISFQLIPQKFREEFIIRPVEKPITITVTQSSPGSAITRTFTVRVDPTQDVSVQLSSAMFHTKVDASFRSLPPVDGDQ